MRFHSSLTKCVVLFIALASLSACATRPVDLGRRGLLESSDHDSHDSWASRDSSRRGGRVIASGGLKEADEFYAPREGGKVDLPGNWQWPLDHVSVTSPYGRRGSKFHQGIDLRASVGTPVHAAADGEVVYVGSKIRGYGRMIVLKHPGNFYTVYAHHSKNLIRLHQKVRKGQVIAYTGKSGHVTGPHLHFEIRRGTRSFDPQYAIKEFFRRSESRTVASDDRHSRK